MGALVSNSDIAYLQSLYPYAGLKPLTNQQEQFIMHYMRGAGVKEAELAAGYRPGAGNQLLGQERIQRVMEYLRQTYFQEMRVSRESLTTMLFEAHSHAANATEEIAAIREIGKIHGLYESDKQRGGPHVVNIHGNVNNIKQIERASDAQLIELAGETITLDPSEYESAD